MRKFIERAEFELTTVILFLAAFHFIKIGYESMHEMSFLQMLK